MRLVWALPLGWGAWRVCMSSPGTFRRTSHALGTKVSIVALHDRESVAQDALAAAFNAIEEVESLLSIYRPQSELCRLNRAGELQRPAPEFVAVIQRAAELSKVTGGAFDITVQPLWEVFTSAQREARLPSAAELAAAQARIGWQRVTVNDDRIHLHGAGTQITLNGIAQGYAADRALAALRAHGIEHALIDTGELAAWGEKERATPWQVGIQHPRAPDAYVAVAKLQNRCLSTSGDYATTFSADRQHNHVFDPRTGQSPTELASVTIAAECAIDADAWSTACLVLGAERSLELLRQRPEMDALFVLKSGRTLVTPNFPLVEEGACV